jgi:hypothetical protein
LDEQPILIVRELALQAALSGEGEASRKRYECASEDVEAHVPFSVHRDLKRHNRAVKNQDSHGQN